MTQKSSWRKDYRFVFTSGWIRYIILALVASTACLMLAHWQDSRRHQRDAEIAVIEQNYDSPAQELESVLPELSSPLAETSEWIRVDLHGTYDTEHTVLARNRSMNGQPGYYVVTPLRLDTGETILIARGWMGVPSEGGTASPQSAPQPASGQVSVTGWLHPTQDGSEDDNPDGFIRAIDASRVPGIDAASMYTGAYVQLESEEPGGTGELAALPEPSLDPGSHLSYTFQWIAFSIMIMVAVVIAARREKTQREQQAHMEGNRKAEFVVVDKEALKSGGTGSGSRYGHSHRNGSRSPGAQAQRQGRRHRVSAEDLEDQLLDEQGL